MAYRDPPPRSIRYRIPGVHGGVVCPHCSARAPAGTGEILQCLACRRVSSHVGSLRELNLTGVVLAGADLREQDLSGVSLAGADLTGACLVGANLNDAVAIGVDLSGADLSGALVNKADLRRANLAGVRVTGASLHRAKIDNVYAGMLEGYQGVPDWRTLNDPVWEGAAPSGPRKPAVVAGESIRCMVCRGESFTPRAVVLGSRGLDMEWLGQSGCALVCDRCAHILWFAEEPPRRP